MNHSTKKVDYLKYTPSSHNTYQFNDELTYEMHNSTSDVSENLSYKEIRHLYSIIPLSRCDKILFQIKRILKPYEVHYEVEHHDSWIQLDEVVSKEIERIRKLGYSNVDVKLDQKLSRYFKCNQALMEIDYLPFVTKDIGTLLRVRKVRWWSRDYFLAVATFRGEVS